MSTRLPSLTALQMIAILQRHGFEIIRQRGSHTVMKHPDGPWTTVPVHKGRDLAKGTIRQILRDTGLSADDLRA